MCVANKRTGMLLNSAGITRAVACEAGEEPKKGAKDLGGGLSASLWTYREPVLCFIIWSAAVQKRQAAVSVPAATGKGSRKTPKDSNKKLTFRVSALKNWKKFKNQTSNKLNAN